MTVSLFVSAIVTALGEFVTGSTRSIVDGFEILFLETTGGTTSLSALGVFMLAFVGIGAAIGIGHLVLGIFRRKA